MKVKTECGYLVPSNRICYGCLNVQLETCKRCQLYHKNTSHIFSPNTPTLLGEKRLVVKVHPFGVTVTPRTVSKTTVKPL